jgi:thioredoxin reductase (NADPH)
MKDKIYQIAVIGGGAAGVMASLRGVLNNDEVLFFPGSSKDRKKSRANWVRRVENMPGYHQYEKSIIEPNKLTIDWLSHCEFKDKFIHMPEKGVKQIIKKDDGNFEVVDNYGDVFLCQYVVLCTGIMDRQPNFDGSIKPIFPYANTQSADYCLRCDGHHTLGKDTSIIGNGAAAAWVAIMLFERYQNPSMTILTNGETPDFDDDVKVLMKLYNIKVVKEKIIEIIGNKKEGELKGFKVVGDREIPSQFAFISLGTIVYNELAVALGANIDKRGYILANEKGLTNIENFYVAGDIKANIKKQIYTAWDSAVDALDDINSKIRLDKRKNNLNCKQN